MLKVLNKIIKLIIPTNQRRYLRQVFYWLYPFCFDIKFDKDLDSLKNMINLYYYFFPSKKREFINEINFLNNKAKTDHSSSFIFPYSFVFDYDYNNIKVYYDNVKGLFYVIHKGKRLYYSRDYQSELAVKHSYYGISIEQDEKSPHRYLSDNFNVEENDVVIDIGAAEGNFSLDVVERTSNLYIFEPEKSWIEALNATFEPWKEKVHIINKFVSNIDNEKFATLDSLLGDNPVNFIKIDVEGAELLILEGSKGILDNNNSLKLSICTYHRKNDAKTIGKILYDKKFNYSFSCGYMLFIYYRLTPPYFRRGLIKGQKISCE